MRAALHTTFAIAAILASSTVDGGCAPSTGSALPGACQVDTSGISVVDGAVVDVLTVRCDPRPLRHEVKGWLEHRRDAGQAYAQLDASSWVTTIPDAEGFQVRIVSRPCKAGQWRAVWRTRGVSPDPPAEPFDVTDSDYWPTTLTKEDCWGWT